MASKSVWGNIEDYWTDEDEPQSENEEDKSQRTKDNDVDRKNDAKDKEVSSAAEELASSPPDWLVDFEKSLKDMGEEHHSFVEQGDFGVSPNIVPPDRIGMPTESIDPVTGKMRKFFRTKWVISDNTDMSNFDSNFPKETRPFNHPFELDDFQKRAISHVHHNEHVFVCAHTSAGKTAIAEYAIAKAAKENLRAIYTSPIKALSNQKYRDFKSTFESVGIITGDVSVNTSAQCLIMTTEILRTLLYQGDAILSQLGVVIFDEIHYVNDPERGVVWEEVIIMLPRTVSLVMLSATVPNYLHFANWVGTTKEREVFAIATNTRPVPLRHYMWANDKPFLLMDSRNVFSSSAYHQIMTDAMKTAQEQQSKQAVAQRGGRGGRGSSGPASRGGHQSRGGGGGGKTQSFDARQKTEKMKLQVLLKHLECNEGLPVVCFCFSRKRCEELAAGMPKFDLNSQEQKSKVHIFIKDSLSKLDESDRHLPQIDFFCGLVARGIGVHHGGLLPIIKEMVEILFHRGLVQVLFATETFAMGVNMPTKSVIFTSVYKHDGKGQRALRSAEYIQMAGRAGRRGLDTAGQVYIFVAGDELPDMQTVHGMMVNKVTLLQSKFRLTFQMLVQLMSRQGMTPLQMIGRSYKESLRAQRLPILQRDLLRRQKDLKQLPEVECIFGEPAIKELISLDENVKLSGFCLHEDFFNSQYCDEVFCPGRLVTLHSLPFCSSFCFGVLLSVRPFSPTEAPVSNGNVSRSPNFLGRQSGTPAGQNNGSMLPDPNAFSHSCFCFMVLLPSGITLESEKENFDKYGTTRDQNTVEISPVTLTPEAQKSLADVSHSQVVFEGSLVSLSNMSSALQRAVAAGQGKYVSGESFLLVDRTPSSKIAFIHDQVIDIDSCLREIDSMKFPNESKETDTNSISDSVKMSSEIRMSLTKLAQSTDSLLESMSGIVPLYTVRRKATMAEIQHIENIMRQKTVFQDITSSKCFNCPKRSINSLLQKHRIQLEGDIEDMKFQISDESLDLVPEMHKKINFLKRINFFDSKNHITLRGRAAAEILASDEVTLVDVIFENLLDNQPPEVVAAVMSAFVCQDVIRDEYSAISGTVEDLRSKIESIHASHLQTLVDCGATYPSEDWWKLCNFDFASVAFRWATGTSFQELMTHTTIQEGSIVRTVMRLDELIRKVKGIGKLIGNTGLEKCMADASTAIHRDIVFSTSLYVAENSSPQTEKTT